MKKLLKFIPAIALIFAGIMTLIAAPSTYASNDICSNPNISSEVKAAHGCGGNDTTLEPAITSILSAIILVCGLVSVVFIVIGGIQYMTSSGDAAKVKKAKDTILYACIGLVICALAFAIVNFVIGSILKQ